MMEGNRQREGGVIKEFENKSSGWNESFKKKAGLKSEPGAAKTPAGSGNTPPAMTRMEAWRRANQAGTQTPVRQSPAPIPDSVPDQDALLIELIRCAKGEDPEFTREQEEDYCTLLSEAGLKALSDLGDDVAREIYGARLAESSDQNKKERGYRILEDCFRKQPTVAAAVNLIQREVYGEGRISEILRYGEPAEEFQLQSTVPVEKLSSVKISRLLTLLIALGIGYQDKPEKLREREPYKTHYEMIGKMDAEIKRVNEGPDNSGCLTLGLILFLVLCGFAVATNFRAGGMLLGGPAGYAAILVVSFLVMGFFGNFLGLIISAALIAALGYGLSRIPLDIGLNLSILPIAVLFLVALAMLIKDIVLLGRWKGKAQEREEATEILRQSLERNLKFCADYCQKRLDLCSSVEIAADALKMECDRPGKYHRLFEEERKHLREMAKERNIQI